MFPAPYVFYVFSDIVKYIQIAVIDVYYIIKIIATYCLEKKKYLLEKSDITEIIKKESQDNKAEEEKEKILKKIEKNNKEKETKGKNQAKLAALQADLRSGISCLCADFRVCHQRCADILGRLLAVLCNPVCDESHRPAWHRRLLGRTHQGVGDTGDRGSDAVHLEIRQAEEMAVRNTGNGRDFPAPCGTRAAAVRRKYRCQRKRPNFRKEK